MKLGNLSRQQRGLEVHQSCDGKVALDTCRSADLCSDPVFIKANKFVKLNPNNSIKKDECELHSTTNGLGMIGNEPSNELLLPCRRGFHHLDQNGPRLPCLRES